ncbi:MAG: molybdenum cofactor biosynthesis protein [Planctomycetaceae bacterium]|nr:molybdenum cofactor biosynthesis protein [Planctomycetaceae bacterium]
MRGFSKRTPVEEVVDWIDGCLSPLASESVLLAQSAGRVLLDDIVASIDVPSFDRAAMDGYAVRGEETVGASDYNRLPFRLIGESMPGAAFDGTVEVGTTVRIMTGAPVPAGANAVVPAEYASSSGDTVEITSAFPPQKHIGKRGEDVKQGTTLLRSGRRLRAQDVGLMASIGVAEVPVIRCPRIRLLITGNELIEPGQPRGEFEIFESNSYVLRSLTQRDGGIVESIRGLNDDRDAIHSAMTDDGADVIIVSGGSSVGAEDHAPSIVAEHGELAIHGVAMRPSSPTGMGKIADSIIFLLPGNPVSCLCAYDFFTGRAIRGLGGRSLSWPYPKQQLTLSGKIASAIGRVDYCRVSISEDGVHPISLSGASILSSTTRADGFVVVPADSEGFAAGTSIDVWLYDRD